MGRLLNAILKTYFAICVFAVTVMLIVLSIWGGSVFIKINWKYEFVEKQFFIPFNPLNN